MATTATRIAYLANGVRDTAGAIVPSANCRFYNPGTLVAGVVYSDAACTTPYSQPVVANAGGQATVYCLESVRMIVKNAADNVTYYDDIPNLQRHDSVYVTSTNINSGVETTLENVLNGLGTSFGDGFYYKESASATTRTFTSVIRNIAIQAEDYGVVADGITDDTVGLQAAITRVGALGGGRVLLPKGTIKITSPLTFSTSGVNMEGQGRGVSIITNYSTTGNAINISTSNSDSKLTLKGFTIYANSTSSGKGINVTQGNYIVLEDLSVGLHRTTIDVSAITGADIRHCIIESTDNNAAAIGINLGTSCRAWHCELSSVGDNGSGIKFASSDARAEDCYVTNFAIGYDMQYSRSHVEHCYAFSATTGFAVAAAGDCVIAYCGGSNTTDLTVNASATGFIDLGNVFTTKTISGTPATLYNRVLSSTTADSTATASFTPALAGGVRLFLFRATYVTSGPTITINAPTGTANISKEEIIQIIVSNQSGGSIGTGITFDAVFKGTMNNNSVNYTGLTFGTSTAWSFTFKWSGSTWTQTAINAGSNVLFV